MAIGDIIVGIDIGTSKVCLSTGEVNNFGQIEVICCSSYKCNGLKKGKIVNEDDISLSISKTIKQAEEETELKINSAYVTIPGRYVTIVQNSILKEVKDRFAGISRKRRTKCNNASKRHRNTRRQDDNRCSHKSNYIR